MKRHEDGVRVSSEDRARDRRSRSAKLSKLAHRFAETLKYLPKESRRAYEAARELFKVLAILNVMGEVDETEEDDEKRRSRMAIEEAACRRWLRLGPAEREQALRNGGEEVM